MKLIRTVITFVLGLIVGYMVKAMDVELPEDIRVYTDKLESYAGQIEEFRKDKQRLETKIKHLKKMLEDK